MKALLVNPPVPNIIRESLPPVIEDESGTFPPLGLLYVAAAARAGTGWDLEILDCQAEGLTHEQVESRISESDARVVGIQAMTFTLIDAMMVAMAVRRVLPEALVVMGGPHPSLYPRETALLEPVDVAVAGEGELAFSALLERVGAGSGLEGISGILTKDGAQAGREASYDHIEDLDGLERPARDLIQSKLYKSPLARRNPVTTMMSSRGCPGRCIFCDRPHMGKRFRRRSAASVVDEMQICARELGIGEILFYDDTFTIDRKRVLDICERLAALDLNVNWDIRARVDSMTSEMIKALAVAGCTRIHYGVESGSERMQKVLRKNLDLRKVREVFAMTRDAGIETLGYFMLGSPTETREDIEQTMDLMTSLPMDYAHIGVFTPYPGTEVYTQALADGFFEQDYWADFARNPSRDFTPKYWNENFSDEELLVFLRKGYARFYRRPYYILSRLFKVRSFDELWKKASLGIKLLRETL